MDEITRQARAAVAWTIKNIARFGGDPARVALGGHSAGAHLTAMCLQTPWPQDYGLPADPLAAAVLVSGIYDIAPLIQLDDGVIRRNSPAFLVRACATPIWVNWGDQETPEFARQSALFHRAWAAAGNASQLSALAQADHYTGIHGFESPEHALCQWLAARLKG